MNEAIYHEGPLDIQARDGGQSPPGVGHFSLPDGHKAKKRAAL